MTHGLDGPDAEAVWEERAHLIAVAYRLTGSVSEAEDAVQEAYVRWYRLDDADRDAIRSPAAWLTTVVTRICLNLLRSARARRELYVGSWLPEPLPGDVGGAVPPSRARGAGDPAEHVTLDESVTMAFLVVLDAMRPAERVALVLHDVFGYSFGEIGTIVGRSPGACRQLATSARRRLRESRDSPVRPSEQHGVVSRFRDAWLAADVAGLIALLDPEAQAVADGGGRVLTFPEPLLGAEAIASTLVSLTRVMPAGARVLERTVNGGPGLAVRIEGDVVTVVSFEVHLGRVRRIWVARNPDKLRAWQAVEPDDVGNRSRG